MYVYIRNGWIIKKSETIVNWLKYDAEIQVDYNIKDKLIYENWKVVKYEESKQYKKDKWILWVTEERDKLKSELKDKTMEYDRLSCDYLKLRAQYDLLKKRQIV